jgi:hypothetical protein
MPTARPGRLTRHRVDLQVIFGDSGNLALTLTVAAIALPVLYFALLYLSTR